MRGSRGARAPEYLCRAARCRRGARPSTSGCRSSVFTSVLRGSLRIVDRNRRQTARLIWLRGGSQRSRAGATSRQREANCQPLATALAIRATRRLLSTLQCRAATSVRSRSWRSRCSISAVKALDPSSGRDEPRSGFGVRRRGPASISPASVFQLGQEPGERVLRFGRGGSRGGAEPLETRDENCRLRRSPLARPWAKSSFELAIFSPVDFRARLPISDRGTETRGPALKGRLEAGCARRFGRSLQRRHVAGCGRFPRSIHSPTATPPKNATTNMPVPKRLCVMDRRYRLRIQSSSAGLRPQGCQSGRGAAGARRTDSRAHLGARGVNGTSSSCPSCTMP